ncbi:hypothetical protein CVT24_009694 [Panaeolus cyanescens]|uniref:ABC transporter domain-containing protein n=1 Tax=Panaeolus cyanescens TaxID=181874 RepID=A0A409Y9W1_9AGAR|nr:hypothetical protein CVT24_009694 [Panaeolus cyanescens]
MSTSKNNKPLPLSDVLEDLAILRATGISVKNIVNTTTSNDNDNNLAPDTVEASVESSYDFVKSARSAIKLHDSQKLATQENKLDEIRDRYEGLVEGISARVLSPSVVLIAAFSLIFSSPTIPSSPSPITQVVVATYVPRRALILTILSLIGFTYLFHGLAFIVFALIRHEWPTNTAVPLNTLIGVVAFTGLAALGTWKDVKGVQVWLMKRVKTAIAASFALDLSLAIVLSLRLRNHLNDGGHLDIHHITPVAFTAFRTLLLFILLAGLASPRIVYNSAQPYDDVEDPEPTDSSFLLPHNQGAINSSLPPSINGESSKYGTFRSTRSNLQQSVPGTRPATPAPSTGTDKGTSKPEVSFEPTWSELWRRLSRLSPYLWPKGNRWLQFLAFLCIVILILGRIVNVLMPLALKNLVAVLEGQTAGSPWSYLLFYVALRFLQGSGGLSAIRDALWTPVLQYSDREMSMLSFNHLLNLSFAWHLRRKTGEVLRVLDRGAAINRTFELILFNIVPTFVDMFLALALFCYYFKWVLALVIFFVMFAYVAASVILTQYRTRVRRQMNERDVITRGIHTDCLLNYETVKYFGGEEHEAARYNEAIAEYQTLEYKVIASLNLLNLVQNFIITTGLLLGSFIVVRDILAQPEPHASNFVYFITYLVQLYGPLNQLGYIYRSVNQALVDTEKLLDLLNEPTDVNDKEGAPDLIVQDGEIEFDNVHFSYDGRNAALKGVSFKVPKGGSVALVGESGSGKSTILRLLYRFYDLGEGQGRILIDGQDIKDVTQKSLRNAIGVVPQDSILFNASIGYNIGYGKFGATPDEIEAAARSAQMHDRIMSFPDGYGTKVGERGVRLSGGEKQRVSIARTLLKNPPILLLDEATSALDTSTEKDIQKALQNLVQGRSSLSIAHRLSTIASADIILVLKDGHIVEQGNFKELMAFGGIFADMWTNQISSTSEPVDKASETSSKQEEVQGYVVEATQAEASSSSSSHHEVQEKSVLDNASLQAENVAEGPTDVVEQREELAAERAPSEALVPSVTEVAPVEAEAATNPEPVSPTNAIAFPSSTDDVEEAEKPSEPLVAFPASSTAPISFPVTDEPETMESTAVEAPKSPPAPGLAVTFGENVNTSPRTGTPDPESEPKRKRISSQNFQRLARRISITTRRQSSTSIIPNILRREASPRVSVDDPTSRGEGSSSNVNTDSPAGSIKGEEAKPKKKDKKDKRKGSTS